LFLDDDGGRRTSSAAATENTNTVGEIASIRFGECLGAPNADSKPIQSQFETSKAIIRDNAQFPEGTPTDSTDDQAGLLTSGSAFDHAFPQFQESQWPM